MSEVLRSGRAGTVQTCGQRGEGGLGWESLLVLLREKERVGFLQVEERWLGLKSRA